MPTQAEFRAAALDLRNSLTDVTASRRHVAGAARADAIESPAVTPLVDAALSVVLADVARIGAQVAELADLCRRRAAVCAQHEAALHASNTRVSAWEREMMHYRAAVTDPARVAIWPGPAPLRPVAPAPWVDPR